MQKNISGSFQEPVSVYEHFNIQYYRPNQGAFHAWHCERLGAEAPASWRHLVWMTYLNDVEEGGETEFLYQKMKVQPRKGLTLILNPLIGLTCIAVRKQREERNILLLDGT